MRNKRLYSSVISLILALAFIFGAFSCTPANEESYDGYPEITLTQADGGVVTIPGFSGKEYYILSGNKPLFTESELVTESYETYGALDSLGRCTKTVACIGRDLMPTEEREEIDSVKPSGWIQAKYDVIKGKYLYNRSHLIGFQLTGENATKENLITGTRYMNEAMIPFENQVADYIKETDNHVMYRVTPVFVGDDLLAAGVIMEAYSVEDDGDGICFNVFLYNNQPGVAINYATGASRLSGTPEDGNGSGSDNGKDDVENGENNGSLDKSDADYILNTNSKKIHKPDCSNAAKISEANREEYSGDIESLLSDGYEGAGCCNPE